MLQWDTSREKKTRKNSAKMHLTLLVNTFPEKLLGFVFFEDYCCVRFVHRSQWQGNEELIYLGVKMTVRYKNVCCWCWTIEVLLLHCSAVLQSAEHFSPFGTNMAMQNWALQFVLWLSFPLGDPGTKAALTVSQRWMDFFVVCIVNQQNPNSA